MEIKIMRNILDRNQDKAMEVRNLLVSKNIMMINLISSPGAGKTTLLERTLEAISGRFRAAVIEGDVTTDRDARRLQRFDIPITLINTEGGCHLDSHSISKALDSFSLDDLDVIFVENVGNLVCPSHFDLGETFKIAVVSTTEGDDKPAKYPMIFREARAAILNKIDLIPYTNFRPGNFRSDLRMLNSNIPLFEISCTKGDGLKEWNDWLAEQIATRFRT
ncbi:MAG TPA: hydrogenase nickel incorporation protein HypB [Bacteroidales bacterium]|nr:hydrogenase nickel incorporation protein HypB [Bacteroidales bacterium]HPF04312.1 hydrogenase nickel incorporation protein HypB [Bacteroidales bacterium]HPJ58297.1 hydrogenase nickel incorporation protein HypB [Bacteroidales bacterium]HPR10897.1 hydrogenase nickel incorporation protein HypB [Bacteroidales bacterium]HRW84143.1 hydrogenase nickel incorporation protein HypB [Bacteroidales bacterium]